MGLKNAEQRYGVVGQTLHWVIALLILAQWYLAELAEEAESEKATHPIAALHQLALLARHKEIGLTILFLALLRLAWRWYSPPPRMPVSMARWQVNAATWTHYLFYVLLFAMPLSGLTISVTSKYSMSYFGLFTIPNFLAGNRELNETMEEVHEVLFDTLVVLAVIHVLAALKHQFIDRDDVLRRMLPWTAR